MTTLQSPIRPARGTDSDLIAGFVAQYQPFLHECRLERGVEAQRAAAEWVDTWLDQFPAHARNEVASGVAEMLFRNFVTEAEMTAALRKWATRASDAPEAVVAWQQAGASQKVIRRMLERHLRARQTMTSTERRERVVYVDDIAVLGARFAQDYVNNWQDGDSHVTVLLWASMRSIAQVQDQIEYWSRRLGKSHVPVDTVSLEFLSDDDHSWPQRVDTTTDTAGLAHHLLQAGADLIEQQEDAGTRKPYAFPLGHQPFEHPDHPDGPGCPVVTWRNIPNSAPIALWWRSEDWQPLFPRQTNRKTARDIQEVQP